MVEPPADVRLPAAVCAQGVVSNMLEENVVQPLLVTVSALNLATECVRMILKVTGALPLRCCRRRWSCYEHSCCDAQQHSVTC